MYKQGTACRLVDVEQIKINKHTNIDYIDEWIVFNFESPSDYSKV